MPRYLTNKQIARIARDLWPTVAGSDLAEIPLETRSRDGNLILGYDICTFELEIRPEDRISGDGKLARYVLKPALLRLLDDVIATTGVPAS